MSQWHLTKIEDAGTPLGNGWEPGDKAYLKKEGALWQLVKPGARRWLTKVQAEWMTFGTQEPAANQEYVQKLFDKLEPKDGIEEHIPGLPKYYKGFVVDVKAESPMVSEWLWLASWWWEGHPDTGQPLGTIYFEKQWVNRLQRFPDARKEFALTLEHEHREALIAWEMANDREPLIVPQETVELANEFGGPAHAKTIEIVDGFKGPDKEVDYYMNLRKKLIRWGYGKYVDDWAKQGDVRA